jgi:sulfite reductase (ferredoxin)
MAPRSGAYHELWLNGEKAVSVGVPEEEVEPMYGNTYLTRKFKIGIAYPGDNCIDIYTQDLGFVAKVEGEKIVGFTALVGGGMGRTHGKGDTYPRLGSPLADITPDQIFDVASTIITIQRDYCDRVNRKHARLKYLVEEQGAAWIRAEAEKRLGYALSDPSEVVFHDVEDHLGWHEQHDGKWFLGLNIANGRIKDTETVRLKTGLYETIGQFQPTVRLTAQQNILLMDIPADQIEALEAKLHSYGISTDPAEAGTYRFAMACPALPTCGLAVAESERVLPSIVTEIEGLLQELGLAGEKLSIRMTGCPNGCARPYMGDIGFVGRSKNIYSLFLAGDWQNTRMTEMFIQNLRTEHILDTLRPLFTFWRDERLPGETFGDYCHRIGLDTLKERTTAQTAVGA